jgi:hypothetical protein
MSELISQASARSKIERTNFVYTKLVTALPEHLLPSIGAFQGHSTSREEKLLAIGGYFGVYEGFLDDMEPQAEAKKRRADLEVAQDYLAGNDEVYRGTKFEVAHERRLVSEKVGQVATLSARAAAETIKPKWAVEGYSDPVSVVQTHHDNAHMSDDAYIKMKCLFDASVRARINGSHRKLLLQAAKYMENKVLEADGNQIYPTGSVPADYAYYVGRESIITIVDSILKPNVAGQKNPATIESLIRDFSQRNPAIPESQVRQRIESHVAYALDVIFTPIDTQANKLQTATQPDNRKKKLTKSRIAAALERDDIDESSREILEVTLASSNQSIAAVRLNLTYREYLKEWNYVRDTYRL